MPQRLAASQRAALHTYQDRHANRSPIGQQPPLPTSPAPSATLT
jgi:hypothetical protein